MRSSRTNSLLFTRISYIFLAPILIKKVRTTVLEESGRHVEGRKPDRKLKKDLEGWRVHWTPRKPRRGTGGSRSFGAKNNDLLQVFVFTSLFERFFWLRWGIRGQAAEVWKKTLFVG
jgi:hypothetical protein